ncbi:NADH:ubiquinone oxidoreductase [Physocladia obscura]|uniref:NADH:ubiquinone reductase (non-electrogenic) n=1 Tax=Physocladia obscura TaxID=109957 RepID=A0AAD5T9R7_9FUNG|nr:NADH:ubiquinone oxidoreductase [Physocladia obscura]
MFPHVTGRARRGCSRRARAARLGADAGAGDGAAQRGVRPRGNRAPAAEHRHRHKRFAARQRAVPPRAPHAADAENQSECARLLLARLPAAAALVPNARGDNARHNIDQPIMYYESYIDDQNTIRKQDASENISALLSQLELLTHKIAREKTETSATDNKQVANIFASIGWKLHNVSDFIESGKMPVANSHVSGGSDPHYDGEIMYTDDDNGSGHEPVREAATDDPEFANDRYEFSDSDGTGNNEVMQRNDNDSLWRLQRYAYSQEPVAVTFLHQAILINTVFESRFVDNDSEAVGSTKPEISEVVKPLSSPTSAAAVTRVEENENDTKYNYHALDEWPANNDSNSNENAVKVVTGAPLYSTISEYKILLDQLPKNEQESSSKRDYLTNDPVFETPLLTTQFLLDGVPSPFPPLTSPAIVSNVAPQNSVLSETDIFQNISPADFCADQHSTTANISSSSLFVKHPIENGPCQNQPQPPISTTRMPSTSRAPLMPQTTEVVVKMDHTTATAAADTSSGVEELFSPELISAIEFRKMSVSSCDSLDYLDAHGRRRGERPEKEEEEEEEEEDEEEKQEEEQQGTGSAAIAIPTNSTVAAQNTAIELNLLSGGQSTTAAATNATTTAIYRSPTTATATTTANAVRVFERAPVGIWQSSETATVCKSCHSPSSPPLSTSSPSLSTPRYQRVCDSCYATLTNRSTTSPLFNNPRTSASPPLTRMVSHAALTYINTGGAGGMGTSPQSVASSSGSTLDVIATISSQFANAFTSAAVTTFRRGSSALAYGFDAAASVTVASDGSSAEEWQRQLMNDSAMLECPVCQKSLLTMRTSEEAEEHVALCLMRSSSVEISGNRYIATAILATVATTTTILIYRNPSHAQPEFSFDPTKKTIAILGTGWASVSLLQELDTSFYNVVLVSPRNYFLFTPLLPSTTVGTVELRSIMQPIRFFTRHKSRDALFVEAECTAVNPAAKTITVEAVSVAPGLKSVEKIKYDYLVVAVGAETATFGTPGVKEYEAEDARKIRTKLLDCLESATFPNQSPEEIDRLLHMVVVGGGPTGVEYAAELHDFLHDDIQKWYPHLADKFKITLVGHAAHLLSGFSPDLIAYSEQAFAANKVSFMSKTAVKEVRADAVVVQHDNPDAADFANSNDKRVEVVPAGLVVWAAGNGTRPVVSDLIARLPKDVQTAKSGLIVDDYLVVKGTRDGSIYALGDCTKTRWAPTAQVASKQGVYLARQFAQLYAIEQERVKYAREHGGSDAGFVQTRAIAPFVYNHQGSLAYVGGDKAVADLPAGIQLSGETTYYFWRSAYLSELFSLRNRVLVGFDWVKCKLFGRDISRE